MSMSKILGKICIITLSYSHPRLSPIPAESFAKLSGDLSIGFYKIPDYSPNPRLGDGLGEKNPRLGDGLGEKNPRLGDGLGEKNPRLGDGRGLFHITLK
ncbi:MAG: hypothetical protein A2720_03500 [Candidatus Doudnabacteria bacterium RIFCSPHIGHO2_01_FULL_46_24]|uniref:Uncharacterized protein n=1 Tax=Candidatus Doudnabacteria bacterium RIFCSPHIGHO2_01_FULL_46_24 TaxID=1817825 RepID=A0A1F5NUG0_9BACT|nr:MAG: hypothetical protein A2720_03500 [Candidatus Doudnabacteria bacterium RIFCSPHIGHO2_01_FULL_46_24]